MNAAAEKIYHQRSSQTTRDQLVVDHLDLVRHVLGRLLVDAPGHVDRDNLEGAGLLGLVEAASRFDGARGSDFRAFAYQRIRGAVLDEMRRNCPLPQQVMELWTRIREYTSRCVVYPTVEELAHALGTSIEAIEECLVSTKVVRPDEWHDEFAVASSPVDQMDQAEFEDNRERLAEAMMRLPERQRIIVSMYYTDNLRLREIGEVLGLSESRVSRLLAQAHLQLKRIMSAATA